MSSIASLLRRSAEFLGAHPIVCVPVLAAQIADQVVRFGFAAARKPVLLAIAPRSVLGGVSGTLSGPVLFVGTLMSWLPVVAEVLLFLYGMVVCARWSQALRREDPPAARTWHAAAGPLARTTALTFFVSTITVGVGTYLTLRGGVPLRWTPMVIGCFLAMASWFVVPSWLRLIAEEQGSRKRDWPPLPAFVAFLLGLIVAASFLFLSNYLQQRLMLTSFKAHPALVGLGTNLLGACASSVPMAFSFVAMSRYAEERPGWVTE